MQRITITVPDETLDGVREAVAEGRAENVSAFMSEAAAQHLRSASLGQVLDELDSEHGRPSAEDVAWARRVLSR